MKRHDGTRSARPLRGFTLIEIVVVLFIMGVVLAMSLALARRVTAAQLDTNTRAAFTRVNLAIIGFVQSTRRLPCPADGALASGAANAGREMRTGQTCDLSQARGVVPWVTLGLKEDDVLDGYGTRLTYRVGPDLVGDEALKMDRCDPAGAAGIELGSPGRCALACVEHAAGLPDICTKPYNALVGRGLRVQDASGSVLNDPSTLSGAAYVVISHGANHGLGYGSSGLVQEPLGDLTAGEIANAATPPLAAAYVDDPNIGDDRFLRPTVMAVLLATGLGPRIHNQ